MKSIQLKLLVSLLFISLFASCTYNESPVYSTTYSDTFNRVIYRYEWENAGEPGHWFIRLHIPNLTKSVIDNGVVIIYYKNAVNNWAMLPYSTTLYNQLGQQFAEELWFEYAIGTLDIHYVYTNPLDMTPPSVIDFKIILVRL